MDSDFRFFNTRAHISLSVGLWGWQIPGLQECTLLGDPFILFRLHGIWLDGLGVVPVSFILWSIDTSVSISFVRDEVLILLYSANLLSSLSTLYSEQITRMVFAH